MLSQVDMHSKEKKSKHEVLINHVHPLHVDVLQVRPLSVIWQLELHVYLFIIMSGQAQLHIKKKKQFKHSYIMSILCMMRSSWFSFIMFTWELDYHIYEYIDNDVKPGRNAFQGDKMENKTY